MAFGAVLSWRQVAFVCAIFPLACLIAVTFVSKTQRNIFKRIFFFKSKTQYVQVPETPSWLLSKGRVADAKKSLQWLRGWTSEQTVSEEFEELQNYAIASNACAACAKQSIECHHAKPTILDKIKELKRRRNVRPIILMFLLQFFGIFNGSYVWDPYIVQVVNALGTPIKPNYATVMTSGMGVVGSLFLGLTVKKLGRRPIYLTASVVLAMCCIGLSIYGFIFFPLGWSSFKKDPNEPAKDPEQIRHIVGNFNYIALVLVLLSRFCGKAGTDIMPFMYVAEVYPFKYVLFTSFVYKISEITIQLISSVYGP